MEIDTESDTHDTGIQHSDTASANSVPGRVWHKTDPYEVANYIPYSAATLMTFGFLTKTSYTTSQSFHSMKGNSRY